MIPRLFIFASLAFVPVAGCSDSNQHLARISVGTMPPELRPRSVRSAEQVVDYFQTYVRTLGLEGVRLGRVVRLPDRYYVYAVEREGERAAFALEVAPDGQIRSKRFPAMDPEMMWNQKYGHRARRRTSAIHTVLSAGEAREVAVKALNGGGSLQVGEPDVYYGYVLFPVRERKSWVGELAVNAVSGESVWERFPAADPPVRSP